MALRSVARRTGRPVAGPIALAVVALASWGLRAWSVLTCGPMCRPLEADEGTYAVTGALLAKGFVPYRDFFMAHPPGIGLVLAPANLLLEPRAAFGANLLLMATLGTAAVLLAAFIVRPVGGWPGAVGAAAVLAITPQVVQLDQEIRIEPLLAVLMLVAAFAWLRPTPVDAGVTRRRQWWTGAALGLASATKLATAVLLPAVWLTRRNRGGTRAVLITGAVAVATFLAVIGPLAVLSGDRMWSQVMAYQISRQPEGRPAWSIGRATEILAGGPGVWMLLPMAALALGAAVWVLRGEARSDELLFALAWAATVLLVVIATPVYFADYRSLLAPPAAVAFGCGLGSLVARQDRSRVSLLLGIGCAAVALVALLSARLTLIRALDLRETAWDDFRAEVRGRGPLCTFGFGPPREGGPDLNGWLISLDLIPEPSAGQDLSTMLRATPSAASRDRVLRRCAVVVGPNDRLASLGADRDWFLRSYRPGSSTGAGTTSPAPTIWIRSS